MRKHLGPWFTCKKSYCVYFYTPRWTGLHVQQLCIIKLKSGSHTINDPPSFDWKWIWPTWAAALCHSLPYNSKPSRKSRSSSSVHPLADCSLLAPTSFRLRLPVAVSSLASVWWFAIPPRGNLASHKDPFPTDDYLVLAEVANCTGFSA